MIECPSCGKENPEGFAFCGFCTAPLAPAPTTQREERKIVSVLFCDLVGFTARSEQADPEEVRATLRPYHERAKAEIEAYGGTVEKFVGDAVMAVFGAPISHEDDAERSVRAGLAILDVIEAMNTEVPALELAVRIAINTGETLVTVDAHPERGEAMVAGDVVNTASRLQGAAPIGALVVGETTHRATEPIFEWDELDPVELKGKAEPTRLWRAVQARGRFGVDIMRAPTTPFVGREGDLALLQQIYDRTLRERSVQLVTLVGEPGVGKSRIISELFRYVDQLTELVTWRQGRCLPYGDGISFWALGEIVKAQAGILESDTQEQAREKLTVALSTLPDQQDRPWMAQRLAPLLGWDSASSAEQQESFTAWARFLESMATDGPAVFVIEDVHWADAPMVGFLEHVVEWSEGFPMLIVCSARPEFYERYPGWGGGKRNTTTIGLSPLSDEETARLVQGLLERVVLPAEVQSAILERAGGNPLYAEEFVRMLTDRGLLVEDGPTLRLVDDVEIPFPDNVQALIAARLDTLAPDRKALLQDAAVLGKVFWSGAVQQMDNRDATDTLEALHELSKKELIRPARRSSLADQTEYAFWHALVRDVAYGQIPRGARGDKHLAAARWIEAAAGERLGDVAEILVHHYETALDLDGALETEAAGLSVALSRFLVLAGERARWVDLGKAMELYQRALKLADGDAERAPILLKLGQASVDSGHFLEGVDLLHRSMSAYQAAGDRLGEGSALAQLMSAEGEHDGTSREVLDGILHAIEILEPFGVTFELIRAYYMSAAQAYIGARYEEGIAWIGKVLGGIDALRDVEMARIDRLRYSATLQRGVCRLLLGDPGGRDEATLALDALRTMGAVDAASFVQVAESMWAWGPSDPLPLLGEATRLSERTGDVRGSLGALVSLPGPLLDLGEWRRSREVAERALALAREDESSVDVIFGVSLLLMLAAWTGNDGGLDESEIADPLAGGSDPQLLAIGLSALALEADVSGRKDVALERIRELRSVEGIGADWYYVWRLPMLTRICVAAGDLELASSLPQGVRSVPIGHEHSLAACEAILAEGRGEFQEAVDLYTDAVERWAGFPSVPEQGFALLGRGRCLLQLGRPDSTAVLREAREIFVRLAAAPLIEQTDIQLAQAIALSS